MKGGEVKDLYLFFPEKILNDSELSITDRFTLAVLIAFDNDDRGCFMLNKSIAKKLRVSTSTVSKSITHLVNLGYITSNESQNGRSYTRRVTEELKKHKAGASKKASTVGESTKLESKPAKHIYKEDSKDDDESKGKKKCGVESAIRLSSIFYQKETSIIIEGPDEENLKAIINRLQKFIKPKYTESSENLDDCVFDCFVCIIKYPPKYFTDKALSTYITQWKKVITDRTLIKRLKLITLKYYPGRDESFI